MNGDIYHFIPRIFIEKKAEMKPTFGHFWLVLKVSFVSFGFRNGKNDKKESRGNKISFSPFFPSDGQLIK